MFSNRINWIGKHLLLINDTISIIPDYSFENRLWEHGETDSQYQMDVVYLRELWELMMSK